MPKKFKPFKARTNIWRGSSYQRGGRLVDKHKNVRYEPITYRNIHSGLIVSANGKLKGIEENRHHEYGNKPHPVRYTQVQSQQTKAMWANIKKRR